MYLVYTAVAEIFRVGQRVLELRSERLIARARHCTELTNIFSLPGLARARAPTKLLTLLVLLGTRVQPVVVQL